MTNQAGTTADSTRKDLGAAADLLAGVKGRLTDPDAAAQLHRAAKHLAQAHVAGVPGARGLCRMCTGLLSDLVFIASDGGRVISADTARTFVEAKRAYVLAQVCRLLVSAPGAPSPEDVPPLSDDTTLPGSEPAFRRPQW